MCFFNIFIVHLRTCIYVYNSQYVQVGRICVVMEKY